MDLFFNNSDLASLCSCQTKMLTRLGAEKARRLAQRLQELRAIDTLEDLKALPGIVYKELDGADVGDLALDVAFGCRLVFRPARELIVGSASRWTDCKRVNGLVVVAVQDD